MAKAYVNAVKYEIVADFEINGIVEKHDIIGAVFGQSEGLLGEEMDLRELQKGGRIGRIEVDSKIVNGKTAGKLTVPSSLDSVKTSLLAAAVESVDKVGPCDCKFIVQTINDTRSSKREEIKNRAKELLSRLMVDQQPETQELAEEIRGNIRTGELIPWGPEKLPAGPEIETSDEIIVVEGRADVINMLKHGIKNVIGMDGANIPATLAELSHRKKFTLFIDGDRGGLLNLKNARVRMVIDKVCRAPDGKEVEELVGKEIILALRKTMTMEEALHGADAGPAVDDGYGARSRSGSTGGRSGGFGREREGGRSRERGGRGRGGGGERPMGRDREGGGGPSGGRGRDRRGGRPGGGGGFGRDREGGRGGGFDPEREFSASPRMTEHERPAHAAHGRDAPQAAMPTLDQVSDPQAEVFKPIMQALHNSLKARFVNEQLQTVSEVNVRDLLHSMASHANAYAVVFDGILTKRLADEAAKHKIQTLVGVKKGKIESSEGLNLYTIA